MIAVRTYDLPFGENNMLRLIAFALAAYCYLQSGFAWRTKRPNNWLEAGG